jgi:tetratricopeptide (TPR) repeat protein/O-antigen ligase
MAKAKYSRLIFLLILYFTFIGGTFITEHRLWPRIVHQLIVTALLAAWLISLLISRRPFPTTPLDWPIAAFLGVNVLATIFATDPRVSVEALWRIGTHILLLYLLVDRMRAWGARPLLEPLFLSAAVVVLIGLSELMAWYFGLPLLPAFQQGWAQIGGLHDPIPPVMYRLAFTLGDSTGLSAYLALLIPFGLAWGVSTRSAHTRIGLLLWVVGALVVEGLSFSRGGLLSLAVSLPTLAVLLVTGRPKWQSKVISALRDWRILAATIMLAAVIVALGLGWLGQDIAGHRAGDEVRLDLWRSAWLIGRDDPLTGVGPYGFGRALRAVRNNAVTPDHHTTAHNRILQSWAEIGLPGVLALLSLVGAAGWAAIRRWQAADKQERVRVAGAMAGLLGFSVHNLVDTFTATPLILPCLMLVSYLMMPLSSRASAPEGQQPAKTRRLMPVFILAVLVLSVAGWLIADRAHFHFDRSVRLADEEDFNGALAEIRLARRIDPAMGYYAAQEAYYLGMLAADNPTEDTLQEALESYRVVLARDGNYDLLCANYAMLLSRSGDLATALSQMQQAALIQPNEPRYRLWVGLLAEQLGDETTALSAYQDALSTRPDWVASPFWEETSLRMTARDTFRAAYGAEDLPIETFRDMSPACWPTGEPAPRRTSEPPSEAVHWLCRGEARMRVDDDPAGALELLDRAVEANPALPGSYLIRAEAYLALGDRADAERDARTAIFLGDWHGFYILGLLAEEAGDITTATRYYAQGGPQMIQLQGWDVAVYNRRGSLMLLPLFDAPSASRYDLTSWAALASLYESQGYPDKAQAVREVIQTFDPYFSLNQ